VITTTREEFEQRLRQARTANPRWFDLESDGRPSNDQLDYLERELGAELPEDYRWFLTTYGGGDFALAAIYSGDEASDLYSLRNQADPPRSDFVAVSDDGTGDLYGFPVLEGRAVDKIVVLDHETGELLDSPMGGFLDFVTWIAFESGGQ
jgi:hypothetical protein